MDYGLARKVSVYSFDKGEGETLIARPSAWHEATLWQSAHKADIDDEVAGVFSVYTWAYFGIKQNGLCAKYGLPEKYDQKVFAKMLGSLSVSIDPVKDGDLAPLAK